MAHHLSGKLVNCHEIVKLQLKKNAEREYLSDEMGKNEGIL